MSSESKKRKWGEEQNREEKKEEEDETGLTPDKKKSKLIKKLFTNTQQWIPVRDIVNMIGDYLYTPSMQIDVTHTHSWFRDPDRAYDKQTQVGRYVRLTTDPETEKPVCLWYRNESAKEPEYTSEKEEDWIYHLTFTFELTGLGPSSRMLTRSPDQSEWKPLNSTGMTRTIYNFLYNMPIPFNGSLRLVSISTCGCNMGHCGAIEDMNIIEPRPETQGDIFQELGVATDETHYGTRYCEYPDSCFLSMEWLNKLPSVVGCNAYNKPTKPFTKFTLDPTLRYLSFYYGR